MAKLAFPENDTEAPPLDIEWGGRRFSPSLDARPKLPQDRVCKLQAGREESQLPASLREALSSRLAWRLVPADETERERIVEAYVRSLEQVAQFRRDVENMVRYACLANLKFRQAAGETDSHARDAVLSAKLDEMLAQAACDWRPLVNVLDAPLISQPMPRLRSRLEASVAEAVAEFTKQFFELLAKLVDRTLFGLVEWLPDQCCNYYFFRCVVLQENEGASQRITETRFEQSDPGSADPGQITGNRTMAETQDVLQRITESRFEDPNPGFTDPRRIIGKRTIADIEGKGKHYHRLARHEHLVINAVRTSIGDSRVVMPPDVERLVEHIPEWLYPFMQVIDGTICRERIIERDTRVEEWENAVVRDEPIFGCEPGVILGPYVLTGWAPHEVSQELERRQKLQIDTQRAERELVASAARRRAPWMAAAAAALSAVALLLWILWFDGIGSTMSVVLATFTAIAAVWQAGSDWAFARRTQPPP